MEEIVNKVAQSGLITLDLEQFITSDISSFDLKDFLFMGMILKEKDYREALKNYDWNAYKDKCVALFCTADAIIPHWAYMLAVSYLQDIAREVYFGSREDVQRILFLKDMERINIENYRDQRVVVKGCGENDLGAFIYVEVSRRLLPVVKSLMYGEPCSTVPIFKKMKK